MKLRLLLGLSLLFSTTSLFAAGGTCPPGVNYNNPATWGLTTLSSLWGITDCYFVAANGLDTNTGIDEAHPWLHAPGMTNCASTCNSTSLAAGEAIIIRGGDTWHFSGRGTPVGLPWTFPQVTGASASSQIYVGVDKTWFSGASWTRPVFSGDNPITASHPASCTHLDTGAVNYFTGPFQEQFIVFDNFEFSGLCWDSSDSPSNFPAFVVNNLSTNITWENFYIHGWSYASSCAGAGAPSGCITGPVGMTGDSHSTGGQGDQQVGYVCDGADTSQDAFACELWDAYDIHFSVMRYAGQGIVANNCHTHHDILFEHLVEPDIASDHGNVDECNSEFAGNNYNYNNVSRNNGSAVGWWICPNANDVWWNDVTINVVSPTGISWDNTCNGSATATFYNMTWVDTASTSVCPQVRNGAQHNTFFINTPIGAGCTNDNFTSMTDAQATAAGFTSSNDYQPTSSNCNGNSSPTCPQGNGHNYTSVCSPTILLCNDSTDAINYNSTTHSVTYPNRTTVARPGGATAWDIGAFQFANLTIQPPTNLNATPGY